MSAAEVWSERIVDADGDVLEVCGFDDGEIELYIHGPSVLFKSVHIGQLRELLDRVTL